MFKMKKPVTRIPDRGGWTQTDWRSKTLPLVREGRSNKVCIQIDKTLEFTDFGYGMK